jgi:hypothetical protein
LPDAYRLLLTAAAIQFRFVLETHFLHANRVPVSLENAMRESIRLMVFTRHWKLIPVLPMF